MSLTARDDTRT